MGRLTKRERVAALLCAEGFDVRAVDLHPATGAWRTNVRLDTYVWEGTGTVRARQGLPAGMSVCFASWDTMTACARFGINVGKGDAGIAADFMVSQRSATPAPKGPDDADDR